MKMQPEGKTRGNVFDNDLALLDGAKLSDYRDISSFV
jgi:hypothetical protein